MKKNSAKKIISVILSFALLMTYLPLSILAANQTGSTSIADPKTLSQWETWFDENSSRYAGGVFLDKSVYTASEAKSDRYFEDIRDSLSFGKDNFGNENFMVALSALGSNSEVYGYSHTPTDTMLILDASTSMGVGSAQTTSIDDMVYGANEAIKRLIALNNYNRVGVVIYNGTSSLLLPLDRYTSSNANGDFLTYSRINSQNRIYIASDVRNGKNQRVDESYIAQAQGTYTQGGIYSAAEQLLAADPVIEDGKIQGGTKRIPIMVLMTDGEPSYRTQTGSQTTINKYNAATNANADRSNFREDDVTAFSTMLTAAWAESEISAHYGMDTRFYTLGYALSANHQYAQNVLDPMNPNNALATRFSRYASQYLAMAQNATAAIRNEYNQTAFRVTRVSSPSRLTTLDYVDRYWQAAQASQLQNAFDAIVDEIIIQSRYYSTLVSGNNYAQDGFISFTDEIGSYMEVKNIKGVYIGDGKLVSGGMFAEFATTGSVEDYDNEQYDENKLKGFENEILSAVSERFGISLSEAALLIDITKSNGYISYTSPTQFSNYIAWYANENNEYIAPYSSASSHELNNAKYIVRSYFYMGDVTQSHVETSMLYALVRVREDIKTGRQIVDMNVPAALLPMVTYTITVDGDTFTSQNITGVTCTQKKPISLLFEVGLDSEITPVNISEKVTEDFRKDQNGVYTFYTNRWRNDNGQALFGYSEDSSGNASFNVPDNIDPHVFNHGIMNTTVTQFIPSLENERYYFTENKQIFDASHNVYTGPRPSQNGTYYVEYKWVEGDANGAVLKTEYDRISAEILKDADNLIQISGKEGWFIKKGTPQFYFGEEVHGEQAHSHKTQNTTKTLGFSNYPQIVRHDSEEHHGYHTLNYHGNNGLVRATSAQGIKINKTVSEAVANAPDSFEFEVALKGSGIEGSYNVYIEHKNGTSTTDTVNVVSNKFSLTLKNGDVAYIYNIDKDIEYTVTEAYNEFYTAASANASGIVLEKTISEVNFVNSPKGYGSLLVEKEVIHPFESISAQLANKEFDIKVEFEGNANDLAQISAPIAAAKVSDGIYTLKLKGGHDALFTHIPDSVKYTVTEQNIPKGFSLITNPNDLKGNIVKDAQAAAVVVNNYSPEAVSPNITISGEKTILNNDGTAKTWGDEDVYNVALQRISLGGTDSAHIAIGNPIFATLNKNQKNYSLEVAQLLAEDGNSPLVFDKVGVYSFIVYEVYPSDEAQRVPNIKYDTTFAIFSVEVVDDSSGTLKINKVTMHPSRQEVAEGQNGYEITKNFTNYYQTTIVNIPVLKRVVNQNNAGVTGHSGGIMFGAFTNPQSTAALYSTITAADGTATIKFPVYKDDYASVQYYYIREMIPPLASQVVGMTYDVSVKYVVSIVWNAADDEPTVKYYNYNASATNGIGTEITSINEEPLTVINTYNENEVSTPSLSFGGNKTLNTGSLRAGDEFTIELYQTDASFNTSGVTAKQTKVVNAQNPSYLFDNISFNSVGTKYLVIREANGEETINGVTYDGAVYHITIEVTKQTENNKTVLKASASHIHKVGFGDVLANEINFNNTYAINDTEEVTIRGNKTLIGRKLVEGEFEFEIKPVNPFSPMPSVTRVKNNANGEFAFPTIRYEVSNEKSYNKEFSYVIEEVVPAAGEDKKGVTYNSDYNIGSSYLLMVSLKDDGMGRVTKTVTLNGNVVTDVNLAFVNSYKAEGTSLTLGGTKFFNKDNGEFNIDLYNADSSFTITGLEKSTVATVLNGRGDYSFKLDYTSDDRGYHYYVIKEKTPADTKGVLYDLAEYHIIVNVLDNGHGEMEAHVMRAIKAHTSERVSITELDFTNRYSASSVAYAIKGHKTLKNKNIANETFEFRLSSDEGEIAIVRNDANGNFVFPEQIFEKANNYIFYVEEVNGGSTIKGIKYDNAKYTVTVPVKDNGEGKLYVDEANISYAEQGGRMEGSLEFVNEYKASATDEIYIEGTKQIKDNKRVLKDKEFTFNLYEANEQFTKGDFVKSANNAQNGSFKFDKALSFDKAGKHYFVVIEEQGNAKYISYDKTIYGVVITVEDNGEGKLNVTNKEIFAITDEGKANAEAIAFVNEFNPDDITVNFDIVKTVVNKGSEKIGPEGFGFLLDGDNNQTVKSDANGKASFVLTFSENDIGNSYTYKLTEINGGKANVSYSTKEYTITVAVSLSDSDELIATITKNGENVSRVEAEFENIYDYTPESNDDPENKQDPDPENKPDSEGSKSPHTADSFSFYIWFVLLFISGGGVLITAVFGKKEKENA